MVTQLQREWRKVQRQLCFDFGYFFNLALNCENNWRAFLKSADEGIFVSENIGLMKFEQSKDTLMQNAN